VWRCAMQLACNAVNCHAENAALFWDEFHPAVRYLVLVIAACYLGHL